MATAQRVKAGVVGETRQTRGGRLDQQRAVFAGQTGGVVDDGGEVLFGGAAREAGCDGAQCRRFIRDGRGAGVEQDAVERGQGAEHPQKASELDCRTATHGALIKGELDICWRAGGKNVRKRRPGAGRGEGFLGRLEPVQQLGAPAQESHDFGPQVTRSHCPAGPIVQIGIEDQVDEAVG